VVEFNFNHVSSRFRKTGQSWLDQSQASNFTCFSDVFRTLNANHTATGITTSDESVTGRLWAALLAKVGRTTGAASDAEYESNKQFINCTGGYRSPRADRHNAHYMIGGGQRGGSKGTLTPGCQTGSLFLDKDCKLQPTSTVNAQTPRCSAGAITYRSEVATPISLVWSDSYKALPSTIVSFKLNPYSNTSTWLWRGSSALPLLVHDPKGTGKIESATQLFGTWSFGGKPGDKKTPWRDGYEALATMDKDGDGKLTLEEMQASFRERMQQGQGRPQ
jgi:hypothetical protein